MALWLVIFFRSTFSSSNFVHIQKIAFKNFLYIYYFLKDLDSAREAVDACHDLNGKTMMGSRIVVEMSKPKRRGDGDYGRGRDRYDSRGGYDRRYDRGGRRNDYSSYGGGRNARLEIS